jgi:hypothetical protein
MCFCTIVRRSLLFIFACSLAWAQQKSLADLEQAAMKADAEWFRLASDLDVRVARMFPCAPGAMSAIEDTRRAATARIVAVTTYAEAAAEQAKQDSAMAEQLQKSRTLGAASNSEEALDTEREIADIELQLKILEESVRSKISLTTASNQLRSIENLVQQRAKLLSKSTNSTSSIAGELGDWGRAVEKREAALREQIGDLFEERGKWNSYYNARLARAKVECSAAGGR